MDLFCDLIEQEVFDQEPISLQYGKVTVTMQQDLQVGCGGKTWEAAHLLCSFLSQPDEAQRYLHNKTILELGSGTGLVGIVASAFASRDSHVYVTDLPVVLPLLSRNVDAMRAHQSCPVTVCPLPWGTSLSPPLSHLDTCDTLLIADCIYLESLFPLLLSTLVTLTDRFPLLVILLAYKRRRRAEKQFFKGLMKLFEREERSVEHLEAGRVRRLHLWRVTRKSKK